MKLIQLNTYEGRLDRALYEFFAAQKPDLLMLQEVYSSPEGKSYNFDFLQKAQKHSQLLHVYFSPVLDHLFGTKRTFYGNAILANRSFNTTHHEFTHAGYQADWDAEKHADDMKLFQHVSLTVDGKTLHLINYHGFKEETKQGSNLTERHCKQIAVYMAGLQGSKILAGDFSLAPDASSLVPLNAQLRNLCVENKIETTRTQLARTRTTVDYIWVSQDITVNRFEVLPDLVSDHAALMLEFDV